MKTALLMVSLLLSACSRSPQAEIDQWSLKANGNKFSYHFSSDGKYTSSESGLFHHSLEARDERGCIVPVYLDAVTASDGKVPGHIEKDLDFKHKLASATLTVRYWTFDMPMGEEGELLFSESKVVDPTLHPPGLAKEPCSKDRKDELRELAKTDPDAADAAAIDLMSREQVVAATINTAGYLCARVTDMYLSGGDIIAHCIEYRDGHGRVKYRINPASMMVDQL